MTRHEQPARAERQAGAVGSAAVLVAWVAAAVMLLGGCSAVKSAVVREPSHPSTANSQGLRVPVPAPQPVPTGHAGAPRGGFPSDVNTADSNAVSQAFARASFLSDTRIDRSPWDAVRRSAAWASPEYAAQLRQPGAAAGGADWNTLAAHHGYTTVDAAANLDDGQPRDQLRRAQRAWTLTVTPHGDGGWRGAPQYEVMYVTLTRATPDAGWQVSEMRLSGGGTGG